MSVDSVTPELKENRPDFSWNPKDRPAVEDWSGVVGHLLSPELEKVIEEGRPIAWLGYNLGQGKEVSISSDTGLDRPEGPTYGVSIGFKVTEGDSARVSRNVVYRWDRERGVIVNTIFSNSGVSTTERRPIEPRDHSLLEKTLAELPQ